MVEDRGEVGDLLRVGDEPAPAVPLDPDLWVAPGVEHDHETAQAAGLVLAGVERGDPDRDVLQLGEIGECGQLLGHDRSSADPDPECLLRLKAGPVAYKRLDKAAEMEKIAELIPLGRRASFCQVPALVRTVGLTIGATRENFGDRCARINGLLPTTREQVAWEIHKAKAKLAERKKLIEVLNRYLKQDEEQLEELISGSRV